MSVADFNRFIEEEALLELVTAPLGLGWERHLGHELRRRGEFGTRVTELEGRRTRLAQLSIDRPTFESARTSLPDLLAWYGTRRRTSEGSVDSEARAIGFSSTRTFLDELLEQFIAVSAQGVGP